MAETVTNETAVPLLPVLANALPDNKLIPLDKFVTQRTSALRRLPQWCRSPTATR